MGETRSAASLAAALDPSRLSDDAGVLGGYASDNSFAPRGNPAAVVYPRHKQDVIDVIRFAGTHHLALVPVSSGPPRFHGDTVPADGSIIVDFRDMNRILKIDSVNRCVMIEPGVGFGALIPALREAGLRLNAPLLPRPSKSALTSCLERAPTLIPKYQYDYLDPLLTLEVIYGTGDEFRTGSASGPGPIDTLQADKVNPWGPGPVDFFRLVSAAQGTLGLVTWAITKTEVLPTVQTPYFLPMDDGAALMAPIAELLQRRVVDECLVLNNVNLASILAEDWARDFPRLKANLPRWTIIACLAGYDRRPQERVRVLEKYLRDVCARCGVEALQSLPGAAGREPAVLDRLSSVWQREPHWKLRARGNNHDIFFLSPFTKVTQFIAQMERLADAAGYPRTDIGCYLQPLVQGRGCHVEFNLACNPDDAAQCAQVEQLFLTASEELLRAGAFFSRPYGPWADMVYRRDTGGATVLRKLKSIFDPHNVLNPGKLCF